jgi:hypothetical protein
LLIGPESDTDPVQVLAAQFAARLERGEAPTILEYVRRYPQFAEQIQNLFPLVETRFRLEGRPTETGNDPDPEGDQPS